MKKILIFFLILLLGATNAHAARFCVSGFDSAKTVQVRVQDLTSSTTLQAWTSTGVTENTNGQGKSTYCHAATTPTDCHDLLVDWQDNSTPIRTAAEAVSNFDCPNASVVLPVMQGSVYTAFAVQNKELQILWKSTPTIPFQVTGDYSAWTAKFAVKKDVLNTAYYISPMDTSVLVYDSVKKTTSGTVTLTSAQTTTAGRYWAEIEFYKGDQRLPALMYKFTILTGVIE